MFKRLDKWADENHMKLNKDRTENWIQLYGSNYVIPPQETIFICDFLECHQLLVQGHWSVYVTVPLGLTNTPLQWEKVQSTSVVLMNSREEYTEWPQLL
ncbi:hypothetical protein llap_6968 [Limosa lapponica baueri]|uniref:Uncharacterized protein n=1 Tax=Limosa lapponica baueri TaxID=1758121 RepID=A0A2I0U9I6_LIMLA|nr:hypothetical protein llap_6968 [Limosa lapponica baueri]